MSCERGDIRQAPNGLRLHTRSGVQELPVAVNRSPRERVLASSQSGRVVPLHEQVSLPGRP